MVGFLSLSSIMIVRFALVYNIVQWMECLIKSNLLKTSHLRVAIDKTVDEQGRQGSKEHLQ